MIRHRFQSLSRTFLIFCRFGQLLNLCLLVGFIQSLLQSLIHLDGRRLDRCNRCIGIQGTLTFVLIQQILIVGVFDQRFKEVFNLPIDFLLFCLERIKRHGFLLGTGL